MREEVNVELLRARNDFRKYYDAELKNDYILLEEKRRVYLKKFVLYLVGFLLPVYWWFFVCEEPQEGYWTKGFVHIYCFYAVVAWVVCCMPFSDYKEKTKSLVMRKILLFFGSSAKLSKNIIRTQDVRASGLIEDFDDIQRDDEFVLFKDGVKIVVSEQKITKTVRTRNGSNDVTVFNGVMMLLDFDKEFKGKIVAKEKKGLKLSRTAILLYCSLILLLGGLVLSLFRGVLFSFDDLFELMSEPDFLCLLIFVFFVWLGHRQKTKKFQEVLLEDVVFAKQWKVIGTDQVETRYVLTPALMERLLKVKKCFYGHTLNFAFYDHKLLIAVSTDKDMFETTFLLRKAVSYHKVNEVVSQLFAVCSVATLIMRQKQN